MRSISAWVVDIARFLGAGTDIRYLEAILPRHRTRSLYRAAPATTMCASPRFDPPMRLSPSASASINRRHALCCGAAAVGGLFTSLLDAAAQAAEPKPALAGAARELVDQALAGLDSAQLWDVHAHLL